MEENNLINETYYDPEFGFMSAEKIYRKLHKLNPKITLQKIKNFISNQYAEQLTKVNKNKQYNTIKSNGIRDNYQLDIIVYDRFTFHNYKYILVVVDVYSRYASALGMTNRKMETILKSVDKIFKEMGYPKNLNCDNEFNKKEFNNYLKGHNIKAWYSYANETNKNAIVERLNRTIINLIQKYRLATNNYDWNEVLPKIIKNYNSTYHRTIEAEPKDIWNGKDKNHQIHKYYNNPFKVNDKVRVPIYKSVFAKSDKQKYSADIYTVNEVIGQKTFVSNGKIYKPYELLKVTEVQNKKPETETKKQELIHEEIQQNKKNKKKMKELENTKEFVDQKPTDSKRKTKLNPKYFN